MPSAHKHLKLNATGRLKRKPFRPSDFFSGLLEIEAVVLAEVATSQRKHGDTAAFADAKTRLLVAAQEQGRSVSAAQMAEIDKLADAYSRAGDAAAKAGEQMRDATESSKQNLEAGAAGLTEIFGAARAARMRFHLRSTALDDTTFQRATMPLAGGASPMGGLIGGFGRVLTGGFASGGYTVPEHRRAPRPASSTLSMLLGPFVILIVLPASSRLIPCNRQPDTPYQQLS